MSGRGGRGGRRRGGGMKLQRHVAVDNDIQQQEEEEVYPAEKSQQSPLAPRRPPVETWPGVFEIEPDAVRLAPFKPGETHSGPAGRVYRVFCVGEKPSIALSVATHLSGGVFETNQATTPVHTFPGLFDGKPAEFIVSAVTGHVYGTDFAPGFESWDKTDPRDLFVAPVRKLPADKRGHVCRHLQNQAHNADYLVLWLDCDREGENICFEVIQNCIGVMKRSNSGQQRVYRARFSSITAPDIVKAMNTLTLPNLNEALSVDARQELDLRMGVAFTRYQSRALQGRYGNLQSRLISYGPCQTPTLGFCVARHDRIETFKPEKYWVLRVRLTTPSHRPLAVTWERGRCFDCTIARMFEMAVSEHKEAQVLSVEHVQRTKARPMPLNTVDLLKIASRQLGLSPGDTMHIAESLYTRGYISYPRTETTAYAPSFDLVGEVREQARHPYWGEHAQMLLTQGLNRPKQGVDAGDHPPITPMRAAVEDDLRGYGEWRLYDYIVRHFLATVSPDCTYVQSTATFQIGDTERFSLSTNAPEEPGFTAVMHWLQVADDQPLDFTSDDVLAVASVALEERLTSPPGYLTEAELITLMEENGIGTDASISTHITAIQDRNFVTLESGRTLVPTQLGIVLIHGLARIDPDLVAPSTRRAVEANLSLVATSQAPFEAVVDHFCDLFVRKFTYFVSHFDRMDQLFSAHFSTLDQTAGRVLGACGHCGKFLKLLGGKPPRAHCSSCDETYQLPQDGTVKPYMDLTCPLDDFGLLTFTTGGKDGIRFVFCPLCYAHPPFEEAKTAKAMSCAQCPHPTCRHGLHANAVRPCPEHATCGGTLVFDPASGPAWRLACNACNYVLLFADKAHKVKIKKTTACDGEGCAGARLFDIEFHKDLSPLADGETSYEGVCLFCDEIMKKGSESVFGRLRKKRNHRRRGRGKGRRGTSRDGGKTKKPSLEALLNHHG